MKITTGKTTYSILGGLVGNAVIHDVDGYIIATLEKMQDPETQRVTYFFADGSYDGCDLPQDLIGKSIEEIATWMVATHPEH